jgi:hypothetical protein
VGSGWSRATRTTLGNQQAVGARVIDRSPLTISGDNIEGSCTNKQTSQTTSVKHQPGATVKDQSQCVSIDLLAGGLRDMEPNWACALASSTMSWVLRYTPGFFERRRLARLGDPRSEGSRTLATTIELVPHNTVGVC